MQRGKIFRRLAPFVALVAVLTQANVTFAAKTTTTSMTPTQIIDGMSVGQDLILSQKDGNGTLGVHGDAVPTTIDIGMAPEDCGNHTGNALVSFDGTLSHGPSWLKLKIQTGSRAGTGQTAPDWTGAANFSVALDGASAQLPKQPIRTNDDLRGVGGNPYVYIRFRGAGGGYNSWQYVGRCVQGSIGNVHATMDLPGRRFLRLASSACTTTSSTVALRHRGGPKLRGQVAFTNQRVDVEGGAQLSTAAHYSGPLGFESATVGITFTDPNALPSWSNLGSWAGGNPAFGASFARYGGEAEPPAEASADWSSTFMLGRCKDFAGTLPASGIDLQY